MRFYIESKSISLEAEKNCGAKCGFVTRMAFAAAISRREADSPMCPDYELHERR